jgi:hypothetical protein
MRESMAGVALGVHRLPEGRDGLHHAVGLGAQETVQVLLHGALEEGVDGEAEGPERS